MYIVKWHLKHDGKSYNPGDKFEGKISEKLLRRGVIEAIGDDKPEPLADKKNALDELRAKLDEMDIKYPKNAGEDKLNKLLDEAAAEAEK